MNRLFCLVVLFVVTGSVAYAQSPAPAGPTTAPKVQKAKARIGSLTLSVDGVMTQWRDEDSYSGPFDAVERNVQRSLAARDADRKSAEKLALAQIKSAKAARQRVTDALEAQQRALDLLTHYQSIAPAQPGPAVQCVTSCSSYCRPNRCVCSGGGACRCTGMAHCSSSCRPGHCVCGNCTVQCPPTSPNSLTVQEWITNREFRFGGRRWQQESGVSVPRPYPSTFEGQFYLGNDNRPRFLDRAGRVWMDPEVQ